uniref:Uncharacterized protein n=1 Tax=Anguilla anguilla TaxID=7936 RepID=A0A0E9SQH7_ANGAN
MGLIQFIWLLGFCQTGKRARPICPNIYLRIHSETPENS